jgi:excisionase family DNA binding protein
VGRKRTEIIIETERIIYISSRSDSSVLWCEVCARRVLMLTAEEAAAVLRVSVEEILRKIEDGQLHYVQMRGSSLRICPNSLLK